MAYYEIRFKGRPVGSIGADWRHVTRIVEAKDEAAAKLTAYETHEHIRGGAERVTVSRLVTASEQELRRRIAMMCYPGADSEHQWDSDTLGELGSIVEDFQILPEENR